MENAAESIGYIVGSIIGAVVVILIIGAIIAFVGKFIFPKSSSKKRFTWGIIIATGLIVLSFCGRIASSIQV